jgi:acyl-CoA synthetase (AMP-forming)/AMP-acid ligase II
MLIPEILARNAARFPDEIALVEREAQSGHRNEISWQQFNDEANRLATFLIDKGIRKDDKVVHLMTNCIEWLPIYFGILRTGAWVVPLNFRFMAEKIRLCTTIAEAKVLIFGEEFIERINAVKSSLDQTVRLYIFKGPSHLCPDYALRYSDVMAQSVPHCPDIRLHIWDDAALYFTSGTTGTPKAVRLTHRNLEAACYIENRHHNQTHEDNFLCLPPLYHTGAKMHWFGNFIVGAKAVILKGISPQWIIETISAEKATIVWLLVPWAHDILIAIENNEINLNDYDLSQWRLMHIGAQPVPPSLIEKWMRIFPHHEYDTNYGLTESTGPGCVHLGRGNLHKIGAIGVPGFDWECRVVDRYKENVPLGEPGELMVKGPGIMKEYYKNPEATRDTLYHDWLLTGDIARMDKDGFIWLVDRKKDVIISGGENIYPVEVEDFLMRNDKIQDAAVIGIPEKRLGEIVTAVIKPKPGKTITEAEIHQFCEQIPRYRRPRKIYFDDVPRNPTGKIEKPKLRKKYAGITSSFKRDL